MPSIEERWLKIQELRDELKDMLNDRDRRIRHLKMLIDSREADIKALERELEECRAAKREALENTPVPRYPDLPTAGDE